MSSAELSSRPPRRPTSLRLVEHGRGSDLDDASLVQALVNREEWAATAIWNRYCPMVYGFLDRALGNTGESEDLTQEVFWRVFAAIRSLRDPTALRSFIYSSAIRMLRWHLRGKRVRRNLGLLGFRKVPDTEAPPTDSEGRELLDRFYQMLDTLSANDRAAFVLRQFEGLSLDEIVRATGASLATVKRRILRASQHLEGLAKADPDFAEYLKPLGGTHES